MDIYEEFIKEFSMKIALKESDLKKSYSLRHRVFRDEFNYSLGTNMAVPFEFDEHDPHSITCIITHKKTKLTAGCVRLVKTSEKENSPCQLLPIEKNCSTGLTNPSHHPKNHNRKEICEISRLAVPKEFRKIKSLDDLNPIMDKKILDIHQTQSHLMPIIGISLFLAATAIVGISDRRHVFAMMEKRFARLLGISGIIFHPAGSAINYHGLRSPFYIDQLEAEKSMKPKLQKLYTSIKTDLTHQYEQYRKAQRSFSS